MQKRSKLKRRWAMNGSPGALLMLSLAACATEAKPQILNKLQIERVTVPAALLTVPDEPAVPAQRMQSAAADYIVHLKINDDECHLDVAAIAATQK